MTEKLDLVRNWFRQNRAQYCQTYNKRQRFIFQLPIVMIIAYLLLTLVIYEIGPFAWVTYNPVRFWGFQISYIVALWLGFELGIHGSKSAAVNEWKEKDTTAIVRYLEIFLLINLVYVVLNLLRTYGYQTFDFKGLLNDLVVNLTDRQAGYNLQQARLAAIKEGGALVGGNLLTLINYVWNFLSFAIVLLSILCFWKMKIRGKVIALLNYFLITINYVAMATNIGVVRLVIAAVFFFVLSYLAHIFRKFESKQKRQAIGVLCCFVAGIVLVLVYFVNNMKTRGGILNWNSEAYNVGGVGLNRDSVLFKILPESMYIPLISISSYLTQGYYGLSLCMRLPWVPTFGLGSSLQVVDVLSEHLMDIRSRTYQFRAMEFGWDDRINWHSMYSWFANDVGFYGVIVVMFLIGLCFALAYKDSITTKNPFAKILVYFFALMFVFIPCNNQIIQTTYTLFSLFTVTVCWIVTRNKRICNLLQNAAKKVSGRKKGT